MMLNSDMCYLQNNDKKEPVLVPFFWDVFDPWLVEFVDMELRDTVPVGANCTNILAPLRASISTLWHVSHHSFPLRSGKAMQIFCHAPSC